MYKYLIALCVVYYVAATDVIYTEDKLDYKYFPYTNSSIHFKVKAANDVHIGLTTVPKDTDPMVEIVIGGWGNTNSAIRRRFKTLPEKVTAETPGILSGGDLRGFWISWDNGNILVGREGVKVPFISWTDPNPFTVTYVGVHTGFGATGSWVIEEPPPAAVPTPPPTRAPAAANCKDCDCCKCCNSEQLFIPKVSYKDINTHGDPEYHFFPVTNKSVYFKVKASLDANIALTTGPSQRNPMIEVLIGAYDNNKSLIRQNRTQPAKAEVTSPGILNGDEFRGFWISWANSAISVGLEGTDTPFMFWEDPEPFPIAFVGVRTGWGAPGSWIIEVPSSASGSVPPRQHQLQKPSTPPAETSESEASVKKTLKTLIEMLYN